MTELDIEVPEVYRHLFDIPRGPGKKKDQKEEWANYVTDNLAALVTTYEGLEGTDKITVEASFEAITAHGFRGLAKDTLRQIQAEVDRRRALQEAVKLRELEKSLKIHNTVWDALNEAHPPAAYATNSQLEAMRVPNDYKISKSGVFKGSLDEENMEIEWRMIAPAPFFPVARTYDSLTGEVERMLLWYTPGGWRRHTVPREVMLDASKIVSLANLDAPVASTRAREVVEYLDAFEAANMATLEEVQVAHICGWTDRGDFVMPNEYWVSTDTDDDRPLTFIADDGMASIAAGWKAEGTWDGWLEAVELIRDKPIMWLGLYTALAAPLLKVLGCPGWITDISGETSHGKTTWLMFAASAGGRPTMDSPTIIGSWDQTAVFIEHMCGFHNNLPVFMDETKRARYRKLVSDVAYQFWQGQGRGRGNKVGVRKTWTWQTTMCTTGEEAMTNFSNDAGTRARVLGVRGKPMGESSAENGRKAEELTYIVGEHYGHLMPRFIDKLVPIMNDSEQREVLREQWKERRAKWSLMASNGVGRRLAGYAACMELVADMAHGRNGFEGVGLPGPTGSVGPFEVVANALKKAGQTADIPGEALREVISWASARHSQFWRGSGATEDVGAWLGVWEDGPGKAYPSVGITADVCRKALQNMGYTPTDILDSWIARGYVDPGSGKGKGTTVRAGSGTLYVYQFTDRAWIALDNMDQGEPA